MSGRMSPLLLYSFKFTSLSIKKICVNVSGCQVLLQARDLAVSLDMSVRVECSAGSDIVTAAMTHLAHSTSSKHLFCGYELSYYHDHHVAEDGPRSVGKLCTFTRYFCLLIIIGQFYFDPLMNCDWFIYSFLAKHSSPFFL